MCPMHSGLNGKKHLLRPGGIDHGIRWNIQEGATAEKVLASPNLQKIRKFARPGLWGLASSNQSLSIGHNTEENMHVRLSLIVKISHDYPTIATVWFIIIIIMPVLSTVTWNMFSMSYFISLNVGLLLASHCQHSRIKLRFEMYWIKTLKGDYRWWKW